MTDAAIEIALPFIARFEGFRSAPYQDTGGRWTIGFGATVLPNGARVTADTVPCTEAEALDWLRPTVLAVIARVGTMLHVAVNDHQTSALSSIGYNIGTGALSRSTLVKLLNEGDIEGAADQFGAWIYDSQGHRDEGLVTRRAAEKVLFLTGSETTPQGQAAADIVTPRAPVVPSYLSPADRLMQNELNELNQSAGPPAQETT
jgi:lysozyme